MYPGLFGHLDCGWVEDDVDDETITVRSNGKKHYNPQLQGRRGGGRLFEEELRTNDD